MSLVQTLPYPARWVNAYVIAKLKEYSPEAGVASNQEFGPIFASLPASKEETYAQLTAITGISQPLMMQYDTLARFRSKPLYAVKKEQLMYYMDGRLDYVNNAKIIISQWLDREDVAAQEINTWSQSHNLYNQDGTEIPCNVFFHSVKVYEIDESRDLLELASANLANMKAKIIIEYEYHVSYPTELGIKTNPINATPQTYDKTTSPIN